MLQQLILQLILILINAFFAATEIAVISLNENKLRMQEKEGDKKAAVMLRMVTAPSAFLSTIQIGITLAGFLGSAFAAGNFSGHLANWLYHTCHITFLSESTLTTISVVLTTLILSYFTLILGELVPKRIAMKNPDKLARAVCRLISVLAAILKPVIWFMSISTDGVLRLLGINPKEEEAPVSEDEIRMMIDIGEEKGTIETGEKEMIDNIFEFNNRTAADIMTHRTAMTVIWEDASPDEIIETICDSGYSRFPVCSGDTDRVTGILLTREYLLNQRAEQPKPLSSLIKPAIFVPETVRADVLFREMQAKKNHIVIVVDEYGGVSGLVTMEDLLEEIVGNIYDESDEGADPDIVALGDNLWRAAGTLPVHELEDILGVTVSDGEDGENDFDTLGGLIYSQLSKIPDDGAQPELDAFGLHIKVEKISDHRVAWALISVLPKEEIPEEDTAHKATRAQ